MYQIFSLTFFQPVSWLSIYLAMWFFTQLLLHTGPFEEQATGSKGRN